jgi:cobyrinic acid a,c-diamide synthase
VCLAAAGPLGAANAAFCGHEFHYATIIKEGAGLPLFAAADADGASLGLVGRVRGPVMGSFVHLIDRTSSAP